MTNLTIHYEMSYTFDKLDKQTIDKEMDYLKEDYPNEDEKDLFESALYNSLRRISVFSYDEIEEMLKEDNFDKIYKWWKENK